jgi:hypothetical protein
VLDPDPCPLSSSSDQVSSLAALKVADSATELALAHHQVGNVSLDLDSSPPDATNSTTTKTQILIILSSTSTPGLPSSSSNVTTETAFRTLETHNGQVPQSRQMATAVAPHSGTGSGVGAGLSPVTAGPLLSQHMAQAQAQAQLGGESLPTPESETPRAVVMDTGTFLSPSFLRPTY